VQQLFYRLDYFGPFERVRNEPGWCLLLFTGEQFYVRIERKEKHGISEIFLDLSGSPDTVLVYHQT
jgi:hypothetical protein